MKWITAILSIVLAQAAGLIGAISTSASIPTWYTTINKPSWNPPNSIFGPVWITLYTLMGLAAAIIWEQRQKPLARWALIIYGIQLALNTLWSYLFFGLQNPGLAFAEIVPLLIAIAITTILFWRLNRWAGLLMLPYLAWVSFATFLNYTIWQLN